MPDPTPDPWVMLARYTLGEITAAEYADYLEARGDDDPAGQIVIDHLRKKETSSA